MKTDDLINALVADNQTVAAPVGRVLSFALAAGTLISAAIFLVSFGWRPDIGAASETVRFLFKFAVTITLAFATVWLLHKLARPSQPPSYWVLLVLAAPLLLAVGVVAELSALPPSLWTERLVGSNRLICLTVIPLLSMAPLAAFLLALKHGAPTRPALSGTIAGLAAGAIAATLYASHCADDSPLFVAVWYSIAIGIVALVGGGLGSRILRW